MVVTEMDGDGRDGLVYRQATFRTASVAGGAGRLTYQADSLDASSRLKMYVRMLTARCAFDGPLVGTKMVDGGNGQMAQGEYIVSVRTGWCDRIRLGTGGPGGAFLLGAHGPEGTAGPRRLRMRPSVALSRR